MGKIKTCKVAKQIKEVVENIQLSVAFHFPCPIYLIERPDFLESVKNVAKENLEKIKEAQKINDVYPVVMSENFFNDEKISKFCSFVGATAWNILNEQGYAMDDKSVSISEMWAQEHHKSSSMEQHTHGYGAQIVGFYFLETPENSSKVVFHDPRPGKMQTDLPEQDITNATIASQMINITPKEGMLIFSNSWLPHSFSRNTSDKPLKFVHFNLFVSKVQKPILASPLNAPEII
jgi:uncharacterized protein (TIGR02466 family)